MSYLFEKHLDAFFRDITSLGGLWVYLLFTAFAYLALSQTLGQQLVISLALIYAAAITIRSIYFKERPNHERHRSYFERIDASSFPSIHSARITGVAYLLRLYTPEVFGLAIIVAALICISRIYLGKHDFWDILAGAALGILTGWLSSMYF